MDKDLGEVVTDLARLSDKPFVNLEDGHERWGLYRGVMDLGEHSELLFEVVGLEPDPAIALSIVLRMLEEIPVTERSSWVSQLSATKDQNYAKARMEEIAILESARSGALVLDQLTDPDRAWSDWLLLHLAESSSDPQILAHLSEYGRTKRIRHDALARIRLLKKI